MVRAFTAADVLQHDDDPASALVADPGIALPNPTTAGNGGIIVMGVTFGTNPPEQWHRVAGAGSSMDFPNVAIMCRADLPGGEQTWPFSVIGGSTAYWIWMAEEWDNLSFAPLAATPAQTTGAANPASVTTGDTGTWDAPYVVGLGAVLMINGTTGGTVWPTTELSGGFDEVQVLTRGDGSTANDVQLHIARRYGTLNETGPWSLTATFTGSQTFKSVYACLAIFRAENHAGDI
jgi:hypothetical protein